MAKISTNARKILANNIVYFRVKNNWSQEHFAELLGKSSGYVPQMENRKTRISIDNAINICNIAGRSSGKLFKDLIEFPNVNEQYDLLTDRDKTVIDKMIITLLNI